SLYLGLSLQPVQYFLRTAQPVVHSTSFGAHIVGSSGAAVNVCLGLPIILTMTGSSSKRGAGTFGGQEY
ncbi:MAG: hypothetical protein KAT75_10785, partial [Dehalococcoidia bacterium]|nr:hypothetical protein [Dehalococcoidia bacterium]